MKRVLALLMAAVGLLASSFAPAQGKPAPAASAPAPRAGASAAAPGAEVAPTPEPAEDPTNGRGYTYDPAGRRDPFRSLLVRNDNKQPGARPPGIAGIGVDDVTVQGIWKTRSGYVAQIRGTDNKSYLLRAGDLLWDGEVTRVGPNEVGFRQNLNDPQSVKPFRDVTKQLNATTAKQ
ncbi:MAG TPA: hypothetical protein VE007_11965 [Thermoanaerobaculia bacterium]|nr:hypothetical protein [Thermoanaerobaculia bacterium]